MKEKALNILRMYNWVVYFRLGNQGRLPQEVESEVSLLRFSWGVGSKQREESQQPEEFWCSRMVRRPVLGWREGGVMGP